MPAVTSLACRLAVASLAALGLIGPAAWAAERYEPRVLFSVRYGGAADQIGLRPGDAEGVAEPGSLFGIRAPGDGTVWVADAAQHRVKRVDESGGVLTIVDSAYRRDDFPWAPEVLGALGFVHDFAAAPAGRLAVVQEARGPRVEVFDSAGVPRPGAWETLAAQVRQRVPDAPSRLEVFQLAMDQSGSLYLYVSPAPNELNVALAKFDADLHYMGVVPGFWVGWDGRTCTSVGGRYPEPNDHFVVYSPDGDLESAVTLQPPAEVSAAEYDSNLHRWRPTSGVLLDSRGGLYLVFDTRRPQELWAEVLPDLAITDDTVVYKFDHTGEFLAKLVFDGLPFYMYPPIAVDPDGNIYHLQYYPDRVDFVKEELLLGDTEAARASELVGLRQSLEPQGWRVTWDPTERTARARRGRTEVAVKPGHGLAVINGHPVPVSVAPVIRSGRICVVRSLTESVQAREHGPGTFARLAP